MKNKKISLFLVIVSIFICSGIADVGATPYDDVYNTSSSTSTSNKTCSDYKKKANCNNNSSCKWVDKKCRVKSCSSLTVDVCEQNTDKNKKKCKYNGSTCCPNGKCNSKGTINEFPEETEYESFNDLEITYAKCGELDRIPVGVPAFTNSVFTLVKVLVPIILIVLGMIDFARAVISGNEDKMHESTKRFVRRIAGGLLVFFVLALTQFLVQVADPDEKSDMLTCMKCFIVDDDNCDSYTVGG